jgi:type I restriction enzyme M protein
MSEIIEKDYSLVPSKYIEFIDHDLDVDYKKEMKRIQKEMQEVIAEEIKSQEMLVNAFKGIGYGIK